MFGVRQSIYQFKELIVPELAGSPLGTLKNKTQRYMSQAPGKDRQGKRSSSCEPGFKHWRYLGEGRANS